MTLFEIWMDQPYMNDPEGRTPRSICDEIQGRVGIGTHWAWLFEKWEKQLADSAHDHELTDRGMA